MTKKTIIIVVPIILVGVFVIMRGLANFDRVDQHFSDAAQLNEAALSWIPFEKSLLGDAKEISISSDVDTNQYVAHWNFSGSAAFETFSARVTLLSKQNESINCAETKRAECEVLNRVDGTIIRAEIPQKVGVFDKSFWLLDSKSYSVLGSTQIPLPPHLK